MPLLLAVPLLDVFIGVALLLLLWASRDLWVKPMMWTLQQIPVVGAQAAQMVENTVEAVIGWAQGWVESSATGLIQLIAVPVNAIGLWIESSWMLLYSLGQNIGNTGGGLLNRINELASDAANTIAQVTAALATISGLSIVVANLQTLLDVVQTTMIPAAQSKAIETSEAFAAERAESAARTGQLAAADAQSTALGAVNAERARAIAAENAIASGVGVDNADQLAALATAVAGIQADLATDVDTLTGAIADVTTTVGALAVPAIAAALTALTTEVGTMRRTCVDPLCAFLPSLGDLFNGLMTAALFAEIAGLVNNAVHNPEGAASSMAAQTGSLRAGAGAITGPLFGITV